MARQARIDASGALHHITVRGIERLKISREGTPIAMNFEAAYRYSVRRLDPLFCVGLDAQSFASSAGHRACSHFQPLSNLMRRVVTGYAARLSQTALS